MTIMDRVQAAHSHRRTAEPQDWSRVQRLYSFCRARAIERITLAERRDPENTAQERRELRVLETMYGKARQHNDIVVSCAVTYFRAQALKDAHHADFLGEWL
jgi:hypothetical protein